VFRSGFENRLQLAIRQEGDHGRDVHVHRDAGLGEALDGQQAAGRGARPRFHLHRDGMVQRRYRKRDGDKVLPRHGRKDVEIPLDQRTLRDQGNRVVAFTRDLENRPRDPVFLLDRLIGVAVDTNRKDVALVTGLRKLFAQSFRGIHLRAQLRFEVETWRKTEVSVARAGKTKTTTVGTSTIRVDRL
jgi:hypothetical protein